MGLWSLLAHDTPGEIQRGRSIGELGVGLLKLLHESSHTEAYIRFISNAYLKALKIMA